MDAVPIEGAVSALVDQWHGALNANRADVANTHALLGRQCRMAAVPANRSEHRTEHRYAFLWIDAEASGEGIAFRAGRQEQIALNFKSNGVRFETCPFGVSARRLL